MNSAEAKFILQAYRPGSTIDADPEMTEALELVRRDPALAEWFESACAFDEHVSDALCALPVPGDLRGNILTGKRVTISSLPAPRRQFLAWAAALTVLFGIGALWVATQSSQEFASFRNAMVREVAREMGALDLYSNDRAQLRAFLSTRAAHPDFSAPKALQTLDPVGCRVLEWGGRDVSLICFSDVDGGVFHLFVIDRDTFDPNRVPGPNQTQFASAGGWSTASWVSADKMYLLAGPVARETLQQLL